MIEDLKLRLSKYGDIHPTINAKRENIEKLKNQKGLITVTISKTIYGKENTGTNKQSSCVENDVIRSGNKDDDIDVQIKILEAEIKDLEVEYGLLEKALKRLKKKKNEYKIVKLKYIDCRDWDVIENHILKGEIPIRTLKRWANSGMSRLLKILY